MKPGRTGWRHLIHSTRYSLKGLRAAFRHESAFRQELALCLVLVPLAWWIGDTPVEWILLVGSCFMVLIVELLNSAIESVVDRIGPERHVLSGRAIKNMNHPSHELSYVVQNCIRINIRNQQQPLNYRK